MVLGIGNTLLQDEGAGVHAMRQLQNEFAACPDVQFVDGGTLSFSLAGPIGEAECLLVIDAAELGEKPGTVRVFCDSEMDRFLGANRKRSVHEVGLLDLLAVSLLTGSLPAQRALVGIQPGVVDWGETPSAAVLAALPAACAQARERILAWQKGGDDER
jgi:hydrogenase maturation protease